MSNTAQRVTQTQELGKAYCDAYAGTITALEDGNTPEMVRATDRVGDMAERLDQQWPHFAELWHRVVMQGQEDALSNLPPSYGS